MRAVHAANSEPIPGYRLIELLGSGGFGDVWKCEAPGGFFKALKFVRSAVARPDQTSSAEQEYRSLQHIKAIRHPFLLSIERVEVVDGELAVVMELADRSLQDLLEEYKAAGRNGLPRDELLHYLGEAAEALDLLNLEHGLQHLDIKPRNLFLVGRHVKVADFGLVNSVAEIGGSTPHAVQLDSITPIYAAPESFLGQLSKKCDQYSLAITYHELLTGCLPFTGRNFRQLALQHTQEDPDLRRLPETDRYAVGRALAKTPDHRFASCSEFVDALISGQQGPPASDPVIRRTKSPTDHEITPGHMAQTHPVPSRGSNRGTSRRPADDSLREVLEASATLSGYRFVECLARLPAGEIWRALAPGGFKCTVKLLFGADVIDERPENDVAIRLRSLHHDCLVPLTVIRSGPHRLALIHEETDTTLVERLKECQGLGLPGIPRDELLNHLGRVAEGLDVLYRAHRLQHLGLTPRQFLLHNGQVQLADFGLAELVWLPAGLDPGSLNTRYAAPELFDRQITPSSDQYSLALIYQELLTGAHGFRNLNQRQMASARQRGLPDMGLLSTSDRNIIGRALSPKPEARFGCCDDLIAALEDAGKARRPSGRSTAVLRVTAPSGPMVVKNQPATALEHLIAEAAAGAEVQEFRGLRYLLWPGQAVEYCCYSRLVPGTFKLKLDGFRQQWEAVEVARAEDAVLFHIPLPSTLWQRVTDKRPTIEIQAGVVAASLSTAGVSAVIIQIRTPRCGPELSDHLLREQAPRMLDSLRHFLQAHPERRKEERFRFESPLRILPVFEYDEVGELIVAQARDLSRSGLGLYLPCRPPSNEIFLQIGAAAAGDLVTVPARVVWAEQCEDGRYQIGAAFSGPG